VSYSIEVDTQNNKGVKPMTEALWSQLLIAAGDDYELCLYDKTEMLSNNTVFNLIQHNHLKSAIVFWFNLP